MKEKEHGLHPFGGLHNERPCNLPTHFAKASARRKQVLHVIPQSKGHKVAHTALMRILITRCHPKQEDGSLGMGKTSKNSSWGWTTLYSWWVPCPSRQRSYWGQSSNLSLPKQMRALPSESWENHLWTQDDNCKVFWESLLKGSLTTFTCKSLVCLSLQNHYK